MPTLFKGETYGTFSFEFNAVKFPAQSGILSIIGRRNNTRRDIAGYVVSGNLHINKSDISSLDFGDYVGLPQVLDDQGFIQFLLPTEIQIIDVPNIL